MSYATYDSYRDSGVAWLGDVPSHWGVKQLKYIVRAVADINHYMPETVDLGIPYVMTGDLSEMASNINFANCKLVSYDEYKDLSKKVKTEKGDVILARYATIGAVTYVDISQEFLVSYSCVTIKPDDNILLGKYLYYYFKSKPFYEEVLNKINTNTQGNVGIDNLKKVISTLPPLLEQTAIVAYLDSQLSQIDALIGKQQNLLEKLAEQRTATITQAVTKGLNPDVPMKDSGVAWLGEVPNHWEVKKSNQIFKIHNGATPKTSEPDYWGNDINWFTPKDLGDCQNKKIGESAKMITELGYQSCGVSLAPKNSIALSKRAPIGHLAVTTVPAVVNQGCFLLEILYKDNVSYLYYLLFSYKNVLNSFGQGSTFMELPREKFAMLKMPIPPLAEQTTIANYLDEQTAHIDRLSDTVRQTIDRLQEYRSTLITQVVTGKVRVIEGA